MPLFKEIIPQAISWVGSLVIASSASAGSLEPPATYGQVCHAIGGQFCQEDARKTAYLPYPEAISYCATRGGLPTLKQVALAYNPSGVSTRPQSGFSRISPSNERPFYNQVGLHSRAVSSTRVERLWTASVFSEYTAYVFYGKTGEIVTDIRRMIYAVRCIER